MSRRLLERQSRRKLAIYRSGEVHTGDISGKKLQNKAGLLTDLSLAVAKQSSIPPCLGYSSGRPTE